MINFFSKIDNKSGQNISERKVAIFRRLKFQAASYPKTITKEKELESISNIQVIESQRSEEWNACLAVPSLEPSSNGLSKILTITYFVLFTVFYTGPHSESSIEIPIGKYILIKKYTN